MFLGFGGCREGRGFKVRIEEGFEFFWKRSLK